MNLRPFFTLSCLIILYATSSATAQNLKADTNVYNSVEQMPEFPGGLTQLFKEIEKNIQYPADALARQAHGKVVVQFIIEPDGHITNAHALNNADTSLSKAAAQAISNLPAWKPGMHNGQPVRVLSTIPVNFSFPGPVGLNPADGKGPIYSSVPHSAQFPGGLTAFGNFLAKTMRYPVYARKHNVEGRVIITFIVEPDGSLSNIHVLSSPEDDLSEEAIRVIGVSPLWIPGTLDGKPVRQQYTVPINFTLR